MACWDTKCTDVAAAAAGAAPNIGRGSTGCGVGIDAFASPIAAQAIMPPLMHRMRAHAEERRLPQHEIGELADLHRADLVVESVCDGRTDRVLRDVSAGTVVVGGSVAG